MRDTLGSCPVGSSGRACCQCCHSLGTSECRGVGGACSAASALVVLLELFEAGWAFDGHLLWLQRWLFPSNISCDASLPLSTPLPPPPRVRAVCSMGDTRFEEALFVRHKEGAGQQKQQLARLAAAKAASGGETDAVAMVDIVRIQFCGSKLGLRKSA